MNRVIAWLYNTRAICQCQDLQHQVPANKLYSQAITVGQLILGTLYGLVDGAVGGAVIAWLYNLFARA